MTVELTITSAQANATMFDLYSNVDGFIVPFETNIPLASLLVTYTTSLVPDSTTIIKMQNVGGTCTNYVNLTLSTTTTTTTSSTTSSTTTAIPVIPCEAIVSSGGAGVTEYSIALSPLGGEIIMDFGPLSLSDKLEILHSNVKKATTGMITPNEGPFDNMYGDPTVPTSPEVFATDQFVGGEKGIIPNRETICQTETGKMFTRTYSQLVWWVYSPADYILNPVAIIRITGPIGTAWNLKRICDYT